MTQTDSAISDEALFKQYRKGDTNALRTLIERHHDALLRFLTRLVGDRQAADDVFQEAFLQVHLSAASFDTTRRFRPWLYTIAANKGRDYLRRKRRRPAVELSAPLRGGAGSSGGSSTGGGRDFALIDLMEVDVESPDTGLDVQERDSMVQKALDTLTPTMKEILLLSYFQKLSYAQMAEDLEIPLGTVKSRLHAAVAAFGRAWKRVNEEAGHSDGGYANGEQANGEDLQR